MQEERYVQSFSTAVSAATNTTYTAGTAAQNALSVIGKFDSVSILCELLQEHFEQLEECASDTSSAACVLSFSCCLHHQSILHSKQSVCHVLDCTWLVEFCEEPLQLFRTDCGCRILDCIAEKVGTAS